MISAPRVLALPAQLRAILPGPPNFELEDRFDAVVDAFLHEISQAPLNLPEPVQWRAGDADKGADRSLVPTETSGERRADFRVAEVDPRRTRGAHLLRSCLDPEIHRAQLAAQGADCAQPRQSAESGRT